MLLLLINYAKLTIFGFLAKNIKLLVILGKNYKTYFNMIFKLFNDSIKNI